MKITNTTIIGEAVAENYRYAPVFKAAGIDFCCNGNRTIAAACGQKGIDTHVLIEKLEQAETGMTPAGIDFKNWPPDLLADYIEKTHHRYVVQKTGEIKIFLDKVARVHGGRHPELVEIKELFDGCAIELSQHMKKEEMILFPFIRRLVQSGITGETALRPHFGTVENPISMMRHEHEAEGERFRRIAELSNQYTPPEEACNTYKVSFAMLQEFEENLHEHIHLENNILFPAAVLYEEKIVLAQ